MVPLSSSPSRALYLLLYFYYLDYETQRRGYEWKCNVSVRRSATILSVLSGSLALQTLLGATETKGNHVAMAHVGASSTSRRIWS